MSAERAAPVSTVPSPARPEPSKHDPGDGFFMRHQFSHFAKAAFGKVYADLAVMEDILGDSGLDWTVVRPPQLTDKPLTGTYRTACGQNIRAAGPFPAPTSPTSCSTPSASPTRSATSSESPASSHTDPLLTTRGGQPR